MLAAAIVPVLSLHFLVQLILILCVAGIIFWLLGKIPIPAPFNFVLYAVLAILAVIVLFQLAGRLG